MSQSPQGKDDRGGGPPKGNGAPPSGGQGKGKRFWDKTFTFSVSLPKVVFGSFFSLFILVWVFIFGIMLGRGHNPEDVVPELAKVMPSPAPQAETTAEGNMDKVLQPQELQYHDTLKAKEPPAPPRPTPAPAPSSQPPQARAETPKPAASPAKPPVTGQVAPDKAAPDKAKPDPDQTVYNYIYQVAAFNNTTAAEAMQKRLRDGGFSTRIAQSESNGSTWYRLLVSFKGTPDDTRNLKTKLSAYGIPNVILRGKAPTH